MSLQGVQVFHEIFEISSEVVNIDEALDLAWVFLEHLQTGFIVHTHLLQNGLDARRVYLV